MKTLIMMILATAPSLLLVNISENIGDDWKTVDDDVMGGRSQSKFTTDEKGHGVFYGVVSLENNGGFSSVRYRFDKVSITSYTKAFLRVKGDGKQYQFRVKSSKSESHSYKYYFDTDKSWQVIEIPLKMMEPTWRGMKPNLPNYPVETISELGFLIGNKKAEKFDLKIDKIWLE